MILFMPFAISSDMPLVIPLIYHLLLHWLCHQLFQYGIVYEISYANDYDYQNGHFWRGKKHLEYSDKDFARGGVKLPRASLTQKSNYGLNHT